ncbi:MAG: hypothetical protein IPM61_09565 [Chlorobi bacterium]|nr:MAG: hypothetical protein UZ07_CHB004002595 [Chlorobi bacterium OLB7]MBK8911561.1 hypothetical protein [Chlorobiota bacterium]MBX7215743.1 hypothetical protein [Candidatus Kapabacteria bacterium]
MIPELRKEFNERFTARKYELFKQRLTERCRAEIGFRISETPFFVPRHIQQACEQGAVELAMLAHDPEYLKLSDATLQPEYAVPNQTDRSMFLVVDFAMAEGENGEVVPRLIEMQGFPSLMGFQIAFAELTQEHWGLPDNLGYINGGHTRQEVLGLLHRAIVAQHDPENVVLLELDPWNQKTCCDFQIMRELLGLHVADIRFVKKVGGKLHYEKDGRLVPIHRIFNRAIVDEIQKKGVELPFGWGDEIDVEWAGHPNWYFRISKFTLPYLNHPLVPQAIFLDRMAELPQNLDAFVLKPLYSFAGAGVIVGPTEAEVNGVPAEQRDKYILQERITYAEAITTPEGGTKAEYRIMLVWMPGEERPRPIMGLVRMGRGKMMGVDFNRNMTWIGAGCNFYQG